MVILRFLWENCLIMVRSLGFLPIFWTARDNFLLVRAELLGCSFRDSDLFHCFWVLLGQLVVSRSEHIFPFLVCLYYCVMVVMTGEIHHCFDTLHRVTFVCPNLSIIFLLWGHVWWKRSPMMQSTVAVTRYMERDVVWRLWDWQAIQECVAVSKHLARVCC